MTKQISEEEFDERFRPITNPDNDNILWETYGDEYDFVKSQDPRKIWTIMDGDQDTWLVSGWHYVNRQNYVVTEVAVPEGEDYEVLWWSDAWRDDCVECGEMFDDTKTNVNGEGFCQSCRVELALDEEGEE